MKLPALAVVLSSSLVALATARPNIVPQPYHPRLPIPSPPERTKTCVVKSYNDGVTDDSCHIITALRRCNNGGRIVFSPDTTYLIGKALDLTFLKHVDLDVQGTITFKSDTVYWAEHGFPFVFQNVISFFKLGGEDVLIYGGGTFDGAGQAWYDGFAKNTSLLRPVLFGIDGLKDAVFSDLKLHHSPQYYHFIANSSNVVWNNISIEGTSNNKNKARNTDGWDIYRSSDITIMNSVINNGDDCVSLKPNSTNVLIQNLNCIGSHGISVGSLGQYPGEYDIVKNLMASNIKLTDSYAGARLKVWPDIVPTKPVGWGGGGAGRVKNCTWEDISVSNVDWAVEVNGCYNEGNITRCLQYPSLVTIDDLVFRRFEGTTNGEHDTQVASIGCSGVDACHNISSSDINVFAPNGGHEAFCVNVDFTKFDFTCTSDVK